MKMKLIEKVMDVSQIVTLYGKFEMLNLELWAFLLLAEKLNCYKK